MRVLQVITGLGVGGAEQQVRLLLRQLRVDGAVECDVVTLTHPGPVAEGLAADGVRVTHIGMAGNRDATVLPRLTRLIRAGRYDVVHTHLYRACLYGRVAARLAGVRAVLATEHSLGETLMEGRPITPGVRALYLASERLGHATVAVSPTVAARLRRWGVPAHRVHIVPNGIDAARFRFDPAVRHRARRLLGLPEDACVIGGVGRLAPGKRFEILLHALTALPNQCVLLLVGGGPEEDALRHTARRLGLVDRVIFAGERPYLPPLTVPPRTPRAPHDPRATTGNGAGLPSASELAAARTLPALLAAMDVLAAPSQEETFGLAVIEGLAAGLPVLYAACPALQDLPPSAAPGARRIASTPQAFARALYHLYAEARNGPQPQAARLPQGTHRLPVPDAVRHYAITRTADRLKRIYATTVAGTHATAPPPADTGPPTTTPAPAQDRTTPNAGGPTSLGVTP